jgi:ankyrin repeat protein
MNALPPKNIAFLTTFAHKIGMQKQALAPKDNGAARKPYLECQNPLLEKRILSKEEQAQLNNRFFGAAKMGNNVLINHFLNAGANINAKGAAEWSALHFAIMNLNSDTCKLLIEKGADVNAKEKNRNTVLMYAAALGSMQTCILLLENGADVGAKNVEGRPASAMAEINNKDETVAFLRSMEMIQASIGRDSFKAFMASFSDCTAG